MTGARGGRSRQDGGGVNWQRGAGMVVCFTAAVAVFWVLFRYVLWVALPFLLAYLLSRLIRPIVARICRRGRIPRALVAGILVVLLAGGVVLLALQGVRRGLDELGHLIQELAADKEGVVAAVQGLFERAGSISEHIPFLRHFEDAPGYADFCARLDGLVQAGIDRLVAAVGNALPNAAMAVAGWLPGALVFVTVLLLACYYFSADNGRLRAGLVARAEVWLPPAWWDRATLAGRRLRGLLRRYFRAYLLLGFFTFLEVFIGLTVLGLRYAFLLAVLIAAIDFLPLLGTGVVLIPWGVVALLLGEYRLGVGVLILYGVCTLLRQLMEPRLVGRGLGLHPLMSLLSMYAGLRLYGVAGMLLLPLLVAAAVGMLPPPAPATASEAAPTDTDNTL